MRVLSSTFDREARWFVVDLWRDDAPGLNYVITAGFVVAAVTGLGLIAWSGVTALLAEYSSRDS